MSGASGARVTADGWGWRHAGRRSHAVSGLDLVIEPGERVLLLGPSGAGKSTLLAALAGVLGGDDEGEEVGRLAIDGADPRDRRGRAGLVLQDPDSQLVLARIGDDVAFGCENLGVPRDEIWQRVGEALEWVGLDLPLDAPTSALSGGQKQRLALAGVLAMRPGLVLLDEPTANLDPDGVREVRDAVTGSIARSGATLIVVEHRVDVWLPVVDRVIVLDPAGGLLADGPPDAVLTAQGERLAAAGVWVPGWPPRAPVRRREHGLAASVLSVDDLAVGRTPFAARRPEIAASRISFDIAAGRALALTGANGSGKSTTALTIAGLLAPVSGAVRASPLLAGGLDPSPHRWRSRELLPRIGTVFQDPEHQFLAPTVRAELLVGPHALRVDAAAAAARADALLERLRLSRLAEANPFTLSGGEKRRLSVATVLATAPQLLVLDEPTFGQDANTWAELMALLAELLDEGTAVVAVTHDQHVVEAIADAEFSFTSGSTADVVR
ncbi:ABC transporter ATP-binding protein [Leifsonia flava]|uniref:Energy-coupling factor ABC transporter ATP-binding protein n=1 Tax=Orlajensenia leifsoniae TaxID=2561933 RepID=A0A4Y9R4U0_9MICO|nr:ATP-binding cassette domain-containing protein [Leifsonia flava]TFV99310.1 energy-coupling factor ABC transporter ATP-binding protein [Leifsonia flava]